MASFPKFLEISYLEFPFHFTLLSEFSIEWLAFRNFRNLSMELSKKIAVQRVLASKFRSFG